MSHSAFLGALLWKASLLTSYSECVLSRGWGRRIERCEVVKMGWTGNLACPGLMQSVSPRPGSNSLRILHPNKFTSPGGLVWEMIRSQVNQVWWDCAVAHELTHTNAVYLCPCLHSSPAHWEVLVIELARGGRAAWRCVGAAYATGNQVWPSDGHRHRATFLPSWSLTPAPEPHK